MRVRNARLERSADLRCVRHRLDRKRRLECDEERGSVLVPKLFLTQLTRGTRQLERDDRDLTIANQDALRDDARADRTLPTCA